MKTTFSFASVSRFLSSIFGSLYALSIQLQVVCVQDYGENNILLKRLQSKSCTNTLVPKFQITLPKYSYQPSSSNKNNYRSLGLTGSLKIKLRFLYVGAQCNKRLREVLPPFAEILLLNKD